ncbi:KdsC family phosphatase [Domibacillus epiphyticus]|uniref:3-deoxy-D-manno-octulosonate 8-phosphate phosphatase n=1 Tax=Domibacillus epiphyticus TaxID=1714355 RepID=A0A1V2A5I0_9BACI|nr:HAD-IIIA family hydrolase [Domibacillus epiphyticus]OMP66112.1 3-deoxy-D-manno-octulosonate 8-phosphate phosphatase [Domibacillus epiphyticus]
MDKLKQIKLIILDVDGVLTDGKLFIGSDGTEMKSFHVKDGMGISLAKYAGMQIAIISGRKSESVEIRSRELGIDYVYQGISDKLAVLRELMKKTKLNRQQICYMGDDLNDTIIAKNVGHSFAPSDAAAYLKKRVDSVTNASGGNGAVREMIEVILHAQHDYEKLVEGYLHQKSKVVQ